MTVALVSRVAVSEIRPHDTGSLRGDLLHFFRDARVALCHPPACRIVPGLLAEATRERELADALVLAVRRHRRENAARILQRAVERGEPQAGIGIEVALDFLGGPLHRRPAVTRMPADGGGARAPRRSAGAAGRDVAVRAPAGTPRQTVPYRSRSAAM
ncbi:TetR-like C-terminal domain-containing protein [Streptomyces sp. NPDC001070]